MHLRIKPHSIFISLLSCISVYAFAESDLAIINLTTDKVIYPEYSNMRQVVVQTTEPINTYTTIVRDKKELILKKFDINSKLLEQQKLPLFQEGYVSTWQYAISPDNKKLIHRNNYSTDLFILDITTGDDTPIWENAVTKYGQDIKKIFWLSNDKFVIILGFHTETERNEITIVDTRTTERKIVYRPIEPEVAGATLSKNKRLLTFIDSKKKTYGTKIIKILDLETGSIISSIGYGSGFLGSLVWNQDETELAYIENGHEIKIWVRQSDVARSIYTSDKDYLIYKLIFLNGQIGYFGDYTDAPLKSWVLGGHKLIIIDPYTGKQLKKVSVNFNGSMYYLYQSNTLVAEIGY